MVFPATEEVEYPEMEVILTSLPSALMFWAVKEVPCGLFENLILDEAILFDVDQVFRSM